MEEIHLSNFFHCISFKFDAVDYHSGMKIISWTLTDMLDNTLHGSGTIPVVRTNVGNRTEQQALFKSIPMLNNT